MFVFKDFTKTEQRLARICLGIMLLPFITYIIQSLITSIKGVSVFYMFYYFIYGLPICIVAFILYQVFETNVKRKILNTLLVLTAYLLLLPISWGIRLVKMKLFMTKNSASLEQIAKNVINNNWTIAKANQSIGKKYPLTIIDNVEKEKTILFQIDGVTDNCSGIAYSESGKEPSKNSCGRLIYWSHINGHWYEWTTN